MLKKEFNEVLKQSLFFLVFVVGLPFLVLILGMLCKWPLTYNEVFFPVYQVGLFIFTVLMGLTLFSSEKKQGGIEYILTLPYSRMWLLWVKILPRLVAVSVLLLFYSLYLYLVAGDFMSTGSLLVLPLFYFIFPIFFIFIISVSLSASHDNIVLLAIGVIFIFIVQSLLIPFLPKIVGDVFGRILSFKEVFYAVLSTLVFLIPFAIPFVLAFKKFDLHPARRFNQRYIKVFVPLLVSGLVLSAIFVYSVSTSMNRYSSWYLTANHKVFETDWVSTHIYDRNSEKIDLLNYLYVGYLNPLESGGYLYGEFGSRYNRQYKRVKLTDNTVEDIYTSKALYRVFNEKYWLFKNIFALFEGNFNDEDITLVLINIDTKAINKIKLPTKLQEKYRRIRVIGVDESGGERSWLVYGEKGLKFPVFRIWEDGRSQELPVRGHSPYYINNILISRAEDGMVFYRLTAAGCEEIKSDPRGKDVLLYPFVRPDLNNGHWKEIYGQGPGKDGKSLMNRSLMKIDLEKLEVTKLLDFSGKFIFYSPEQCYLLDSHLNPRNFYRVLGNGQLLLLRAFSGFNTRSQGNFFQISRSGIITRENGTISIYAFPDLQVISFKN